MTKMNLNKIILLGSSIFFILILISSLVKTDPIVKSLTAKTYNNDYIPSCAPKPKTKHTPEPEFDPLINDALIPPDYDPMEVAATEPTSQQTSEFMIGDVSVAIILLESNGVIDPNLEDWDTTRVAKVISKIHNALNWWAEKESRAFVTWTYQEHIVPTSYEPISRAHTKQSLWVKEAMAYLMPGLVGSWNLDEDSGSIVPDSSGNGNHGTVYEATWSPTDCISSPCLSFDGVNDYVRATTTGMTTSQGTVVLWAKPANVPSGKAYIFSHRNEGENNRIYLLNKDGNFNVGLGDTISVDTGYTFEYVVEDGKKKWLWTHLALTWSGANYKAYVNGSLVKSGSTSEPTSIASNIYMGGYLGTQKFFNGKMDEVKIFNYALTEEEIMTEYNSRDRFDRVRNFDDDLRNSDGTDWAFTIFVVDSLNDDDGKFTDGWFAWSYIHGPYFAMTYNNSYYKIDNMDYITAHETGHIFGAADQYRGSWSCSVDSDCSRKFGYLQVENQNCDLDACLSDVPSIMRAGTYNFKDGNLDDYARGQVGWRDEDGDNILDAIDSDYNPGSDSDGDGIVDYWDECPNLWGKPEYMGCRPYGGGCPFVYTWDGSEYIIDNNLLPFSEANPGEDVEDYYKLEKPLAVKNGKYPLIIGEFEQEHSYFDQVQLLAIDHDSDFNVAVSPDGEILTYKNPVPALLAIDNKGNDVSDILKSIDDDHYMGNESDYIILDFGKVDAENVKLVMRADMKTPVGCPGCSIHIQILDSKEWYDAAIVEPRDYWADEIFDLSEYLSEGELKVRLYFTSTHKLDFVGLDTSEQREFDVKYGNLVSAIHSLDGNVKQKLFKCDKTYAELIPGQEIQLEFTLPNNNRVVRDFIFFSKGYYLKIQ